MARSLWRGWFALSLCAGILGAARAETLTPEQIVASLKVVTIDGLPVTGESSPGGKILLNLAAYAASPGMIDERRIGGGMPYAEEIALAVLPPQSAERAAYMQDYRFKGVDDAERAATRRRFFENYGPIIVAAAPKPPFRVVLADRDVLGYYDPKRGGLPVPRGPNYAHAAYFGGYLIPKVAEKIVETEAFWPMSLEDADGLLTELAASAPSPGLARQAQALAVVEIRAIDPGTRVADVVLVDYMLYDGELRRKLFDYPESERSTLLPMARTPDPAPNEEASGNAPLEEGQFATARAAADRALQLCEAHNATRNRVKCDCIAEFVAHGWQASPRRHVYTLLSEAVTAHDVDCANPTAQYDAWLYECAESPGESARKLGKRKYCHCVADRTSGIGPVRARVSCGMLSDYAAPADSPIPE